MRMYLYHGAHAGRSKASNCVTDQLLPGLQMVCNMVMSSIENSVCLLIDATHSMKKISTQLTKPTERYAILILQAPEDCTYVYAK